MASESEKPVIAAKKSFVVEVKAGETYYWCACGRSKTQPFCDGSHAGTSFSPVPYTATETKMVAFCGCKHSSKGSVCDGSHKKL